MNKTKGVRVVAKGFIAWTFAIALGLLFFLVLHVIAAQITPPPVFLNEAYPDISTQELCEAEGGRWVEASSRVKNPSTAQPIAETDTSYCQGPLQFEREQTLQREKNQQTALFVFAIGGATAVAGALLIVVLHPVAPGLMLGGIAAFLRAGFHVWTLEPGIGRLLTIVAVFAVLVVIGMKVFGEDSHSK